MTAPTEAYLSAAVVALLELLRQGGTQLALVRSKGYLVVLAQREAADELEAAFTEAEESSSNGRAPSEGG